MDALVASDWTVLTFADGVQWKRRAVVCEGLATLTLEGPSDTWWGVGFDAVAMSDQPYSMIIDGHGVVSERKMGYHSAGVPLSPSVAVHSNTVNAGRRTVRLNRPLKGATADHLSFSASASGVPFIAAVGSTPQISYHRVKGGSEVLLVQVGGPLCVCPSGKLSGSIDGVPFKKDCHPMPRSSLAKEHNDVCSIESYHGGLNCCTHKSILLSREQTIPAALDTYRMKFRIYYKDHVNEGNAFFLFVTNELGAGEYDVPQCPRGMPTSQCVHTITGEFRLRDAMRKCAPGKPVTDVWCAPGWDEAKQVALLRAGTHCHAPACLNETLFNLDTGEVVCYNEPLYGEGSFPSDGQHFDEEGYAVAIPPCLWGSEEEGLRPSPVLGLDTRLRSVKHVNNTFYHYGVMAQWQMRGMWVDP